MLVFVITSGGGAMFASRALTEQLFGGGLLDPEHFTRYADQFTDLVLDALQS